MATLGDVVARITAEMGRGDPATVRRQVVTTIVEHSKEFHHFVERRLGLIELAAGQIWYSQCGFRTPSQASLAQIEAETAVPTEDIEWSFDDFPYVGRVQDILQIDWAGIQDGTDNTRYTIAELPGGEFETMINAPVSNGPPRYWTRYNEQIGIYPPPERFYMFRFRARVKPRVPVLDTEESSYFEFAEELIRAGAKARLCRDDYRDTEGAQLFEMAERAALARLRSENTLRSRGRIRPSW